MKVTARNKQSPIKDPLGPIEEDDADDRDSELYDSKVDS